TNWRRLQRHMAIASHPCDERHAKAGVQAAGSPYASQTRLISRICQQYHFPCEPPAGRQAAGLKVVRWRVMCAGSLPRAWAGWADDAGGGSADVVPTLQLADRDQGWDHPARRPALPLQSMRSAFHATLEFGILRSANLCVSGDEHRVHRMQFDQIPDLGIH